MLQTTVTATISFRKSCSNSGARCRASKARQRNPRGFTALLSTRRSRGIARDEAVHMIVTGFFEPVLDRIPLEELRERVADVIESKI